MFKTFKMSTTSRKNSAKKQQEQLESIDIPLPQPNKKEKNSFSKQESAHAVVIDDDSTPSVIVPESKPSKKEKKSFSKSEVQDNSVQKKDNDEVIESGSEGAVVIEKSKKQPPKSLGEQITDSIETIAIQSRKIDELIGSKDAFQKQFTDLISSRKNELKKQKVDESGDQLIQFLEKQKECSKNEIITLKSLIRELSSVSKVIEKANKQLELKKKDPSKPKKIRSPIFVAVSTDSMNQFIKNNQDLKTNDGKQIFEQTPEINTDGRFLVERTQLMQLIHAYIRDKSLRKKEGFIELDEQLKPLFHTYLEGDFSKKVNNKYVICILSHHLEKKA